MPLVTRDAEVTLVVLVYRSLKWLDWCMEGVEQSRNETRYRWFVVANDPTPEVACDPRVSLVFTNENSREFYINRVYRAWNAGVLEAPTQKVVMLNTDMWGHDHWIDALMEKKETSPWTVPTSLLVESGHLESAMPEYVKNLGQTPEDFDAGAFHQYALEIVKPPFHEPGRLFMPILVDRQEFDDVGGYPEGNPPGTTGDKDLIRRYKEMGLEHVTCLGSVVYHAQLGEQRWP